MLTIGIYTFQYVLNECINTFKDSVLKQLGVEDKHFREYIEQCGELCWLMCVQSPPVYMERSWGDKFDKDKYRPYTRDGKTVEFLVWPVLYLHRTGGIMLKGVAQGKR